MKVFLILILINIILTSPIQIYYEYEFINNYNESSINLVDITFIPESCEPFIGPIYYDQSQIFKCVIKPKNGDYFMFETSVDYFPYDIFITCFIDQKLKYYINNCFN